MSLSNDKQGSYVSASNMTKAPETRAPRVTLGLPVYNGERYLRDTMESLLVQTFTDFELIISDNASTDGTEKMCREYVARDSRVRYVRNDRNLGPAANYNVSLDQARGELFKWCAADDVCAPTFVEKCVAALDANPDAVNAYPLTRIIDSDGKEVRDYDYNVDLDDPRRHVRIARLAMVDHRRHGAHEMFGVMRRDALIRVGKKRCHVRADSVVLLRLALLGRFVRVNSTEFFNRDHNARSSKYLERRAVRPNSWISKKIGVGPLPSAEWWDQSLRGKIVFPDWRVMGEYYKSINEMPLTFGQRMRCRAALFPYTVRHVPKLVRDLLIACEQVIRKPFSRSMDRDGNFPTRAPVTASR